MNERRSFDPDSPGAQLLARTWLPHLERWEVRLLTGSFLNSDSTPVAAGEVIEVPGHRGQMMVQSGSAELIQRRRVRARDR
jgi:hypothetical protein